jgi:hypothetical protein
VPLAEKISLPEGYGKTTERLSCESVQAQLEEAKQYWLATNRADGSPHLVPLDGLWVAHNTRRWLEANPGRDLPPNMYNVVHGMYTTPFTELMAGDAPNDLTLLAALNRSSPCRVDGLGC